MVYTQKLLRERGVKFKRGLGGVLEGLWVRACEIKMLQVEYALNGGKHDV